MAGTWDTAYGVDLRRKIISICGRIWDGMDIIWHGNFQSIGLFVYASQRDFIVSLYYNFHFIIGGGCCLHPGSSLDYSWYMKVKNVSFFRHAQQLTLIWTGPTAYASYSRRGLCSYGATRSNIRRPAPGSNANLSNNDSGLFPSSIASCSGKHAVKSRRKVACAHRSSV